MKKLLAILASAAWAASSQEAHAQSTTQVYPRQYFLLQQQLLTNKQNLNSTTNVYTNNFPAYFGSNTNNWPTNLPVGVATNTFIPFSGAHALGLTLLLESTNTMPGASNLVITAYPAYDKSGGGSNTIGSSFGQFFGTNYPLLTWTIPWTTNGAWSTNIPTSTWEPATSIGFTINNQCNSNLTATLIMQPTP